MVTVFQRGPISPILTRRHVLDYFTEALSTYADSSLARRNRVPYICEVSSRPTGGALIPLSLF